MYLIIPWPFETMGKSYKTLQNWREIPSILPWIIKKKWTFDDLDRFLHGLPSSLIKLLDQYLILSAVHLKLQFLLRIGIGIQGSILLDFVCLADDWMPENALAKDAVEVIVVKWLAFGLDYVADVFLGGGDIREDL